MAFDITSFEFSDFGIHFYSTSESFDQITSAGYFNPVYSSFFYSPTRRLASGDKLNVYSQISKTTRSYTINIDDNVVTLFESELGANTLYPEYFGCKGEYESR